MDEDLRGRTVDGRYRLDELLGEGAMGAVYSGIQLAVDRKVAIKVLHAFLRTHENFKARFELEARALARLSHPNCITFFDFGYAEDIEAFFMVVEYVEGQALADMMEYRLPYAEALQIIYQVTLGLEHAHGQGILHRDLKPENVMIQMTNGFPRVKVLDFGLARLLEDDSAPVHGRRRQRLTQAGEIYGTPAYMSPEQCRGSRDVGAAADLYSLGILFYELLDGRLPFYDSSPAQLMVYQISNPVPPMENPVDPAVESLVQWLLQKSPDARPSSATEVLAALRPHLGLDESQESSIGFDSGDFAVLNRAQTPSERVSVPTMVFESESESDPIASGGPSPPESPVKVAAPSRLLIGAILAGALVIVLIAFGAGMYYSTTIEQASAEPSMVEQGGANSGAEGVVGDTADAQ